MDCIVHGVAKSRTRLSDFHFQLVSANLILLFYLSPPCHSPFLTVSLFSMSVSLFLFCMYVYLYYFLYYIYSDIIDVSMISDTIHTVS